MSEQELYGQRSCSDLERFVDEKVQPNEDFLSNCGRCVDELCHILQKHIPEKYRPAEVNKGGSLGKGTALKDMSDIDVTLLLRTAKYPTVKEVCDDMDTILRDIRTDLQRNTNCVVSRTSPKSLQVELTQSGIKFEADILPSCYLDLSSSDAFKHPFIKAQPTKLKKLIRLMKYWKKKCLKGVKEPSSLLVELVTIDQWEKASKPQSFDLKKGLYVVLNAIADYHTLDAEWFIYYDKSVARELVSHSKPYVIDPDNPFCNVAGKYKYWPDLAAKAKEFLSKPLFNVPSGSKYNWSSY